MLALRQTLDYTLISNPISTAPDNEKCHPNLRYEETEAREIVITSPWLVNVEFKHKLV